MKKVLCLLVSLICTSVILFSGCLGGFTPLFSGCAGCYSPGDNKEEQDGFYYCLKGDNGYVATEYNKAEYAAILGLVDNSQEIEELIIPEELGGYPVEVIGDSFQLIGVPAENYGIDASNINRIVINHECLITSIGFMDFKGELEINADVYISIAEYIDNPIVIFNVDLETLTDYEDWSEVWENARSDKFKVEFDAVGGEQKTYAYAVLKNSTIKAPEQPTKDGYTFAGWFKDENYETEWNFEEDTVTSNTTLYAKWIEE